MKKRTFFLIAMMMFGMLALPMQAFANPAGEAVGKSDSQSRIQRYEKVGDFSEKIWSSGLPPIIRVFPHELQDLFDPSVKYTINQQIRKLGGDEAIDIKIEYCETTPVQFILGNLIGGIWKPRTLIVSGTVVRILD